MKDLQETWENIMSPATHAPAPVNDDVHQDVSDIPPAQR
jgi:hypothetical protein